MKNPFSFYARALTSISVSGGKADFRLVNAIANEIIGKLVLSGCLDSVEVQCWADDTEAPGASRYDVIVIKYHEEEVVVRIPAPLIDSGALASLVGMARILNLNRVRSAVGDFDSDEEKEARQEIQAPYLELAEDNNLLWFEFVGQYLTDERFSNLSPNLQKILAEKVGKVRAKMLVTA